MADKKEEKRNISKDLLDAMLVGVKTQEDLWGERRSNNEAKQGSHRTYA